MQLLQGNNFFHTIFRNYIKDSMTDKAAGKICGGVESDKFNIANENRQEAYIDRRRWELKVGDNILHAYL